MAAPRGKKSTGDGAARPKRYGIIRDVFRIAKECAERVGLAGEAAEDCAAEFLAVVLADDGEKKLLPPDMRDDAGAYYHGPWVYRAALHYALNVRKRQTQEARRVGPWLAEQTAARPSSDAEAVLMRRVARAALQDAVTGLDAGPRTLVQLCHFQGLSMAEIAQATGRTEHAVQEALRRARRHLKSELLRHGWDADEMRLHLADAPNSESENHDAEK